MANRIRTGDQRCGNNNKDEDNSPKTLNDQNSKFEYLSQFIPLQKFKEFN